MHGRAWFRDVVRLLIALTMWQGMECAWPQGLNRDLRLPTTARPAVLAVPATPSPAALFSQVERYLPSATPAALTATLPAKPSARSLRPLAIPAATVSLGGPA